MGNSLLKAMINKTDAELDETLAQSGYTKAHFVKAITSIASYSISYVLNEVHLAIEQMHKAVKSHPLNVGGDKGFKNELNKLINFDKSRKARESVLLSADERDRIRIMAKYAHEDMEMSITKLRCTICNYIGYHGHKESTLLGSVILAQAMCDFACTFVHKRVEEVKKYKPDFCRVDALAPNKTHELADALVNRVASLVGDTEEEMDINNCKEIQYALDELENICLDIDMMSSYCAEGLEKTHTKEWLKENDPKAYYILHPMEDPEWLAQKEAEYQAQLEREAEEQAAIIDAVEEAEDDIDLNALFASKGWKTKKVG